jgi:hypothetical protein
MLKASGFALFSEHLREKFEKRHNTCLNNILRVEIFNRKLDGAACGFSDENCEVRKCLAHWHLAKSFLDSFLRPRVLISEEDNCMVYVSRALLTSLDAAKTCRFALIALFFISYNLAGSIGDFC